MSSNLREKELYSSSIQINVTHCKKFRFLVSFGTINFLNIRIIAAATNMIYHLSNDIQIILSIHRLFLVKRTLPTSVLKCSKNEFIELFKKTTVINTI